MAYAMLVDRMIGEVRAEQHLAAITATAGGEAVWPVLDDRLEAFDKALAAEPKVIDPEQIELRRALGLRT